MNGSNFNSSKLIDLVQLQKTVDELKRSEERNQEITNVLIANLLQANVYITNLMKSKESLENRVSELEYDNRIQKKLEQLGSFFIFRKYDAVQKEANEFLDTHSNLPQDTFFKFFDLEMRALVALDQNEEILSRLDKIENEKPIGWNTKFVKWRMIALQNIGQFGTVIELGTKFLNGHRFLAVEQKVEMEEILDNARTILELTHAPKRSIEEDEVSYSSPKRQKPSQS